MINIDQISMVGVGLLGTSVALVLLLSVIPVFAQTEQTTITDIENNPVAQDILNKIEETKKWIAELEEKQSELLAANQELEEKRNQARQSLENDLKQWEDLWGKYSSENVFAKFVEKIPSNSTRAVFWDQYSFTQSKVQAGRDAFTQVTNNGGNFQEAYAAYLKAAEIKRIEMIQVNSMFNVMHNLAYYNQQILFDSNGKFDMDLSGDQLRQYYLDYRTNPAYLLANPLDTISWNAFSETNPNTECREGYVLIYRNQAKDYVCVTDRTAEMWQRHGMGSTVHKAILQVPDEITSIQMNYDRISEKVTGINLKIQKIHDNYEVQIKDMEKKYDHMFIKTEAGQKDEEKLVLNNLKNDKISTENFSLQITDIREKYDAVEKNMIKEKFQTLEIMEKSLKENLNILISKYEYDSEIQIIWDAGYDTYNAIMAA